MRVGSNALRAVRSPRRSEGELRAGRRSVRFEDGHLRMAEAGKDDRRLLAIVRAASQARCGKVVR